MLKRHIPTIALCVTIACGNLAYAAGQSGADSNFIAFKSIISTQPSTPTVINTVTVICPFAGFLVSTASAQISMNTSGFAGEPSIQYGITKNATAQDINNHHLLSQYTVQGFTWASVSYQRTDSCTAGQTVKMRFVAHKLDANTADAQKSNLTVVFYQDPKI